MMQEAATSSAAYPQDPVRPRDLGQARAGMRQLISVMFLAFCFFPYISIIPTGTDLQPYAFVMSLLVCACGIPEGLPGEIWLAAIAPCAALVIWLGTDMSMFGLRETLSYLSPVSIAVATIAVLRQPQGPQLVRRFVVIATYVWLAFGILELAFGRGLLQFAIPTLQTDRDRGVTGLATEPSFYGIFCLFLLMLNYITNKNDRSIAILLWIQILFLAQSSITVLIALVFLLYAAIIYTSLPVLTAVAAVIAVLVGAAIYVLPYFKDARIAFLATRLLADPWIVVSVDTSVNARLGHTIFPIMGFYDAWGVPYGFEHFSEYVAKRAPQINYVWLGVLDRDKKIMSGFGAGIFELGWFGLAMPLATAIAILRHYRKRLRFGILLAVFVTTIMFFAIQASLPLFGLMLGWMMGQEGPQAATPGRAGARA